MIRVVAYFENGYCGCDQTDFFEFDDDITTSEIHDIMWESKVAYAESFSHVHFGWEESYTDEEWNEWVEEYNQVTWEIIDDDNEWERLKEEEGY